MPLKRTLLSGLALGVAAWLWQSDLLPGQTEGPAQRAAFSGMTSLEDGLVKARSLDIVIPLTFADGEIDLLLAGAPACHKCMLFIQEGLDELVSAADKKGLDLVYMPLALTNYGLTISALQVCMMPLTTTRPDDLVSKGYEAMARIAEIMSAARGRDHMDETEAQARVEAELEQYHKSAGLEGQMDSSCIREKARDLLAAIDDFRVIFDLQELPAIYAPHAGGGVQRLKQQGQGRPWRTLIP